jgi:hypothetical protein
MNIIMVEVVSISETSVYFYHTARRSILEDCHLYNRRYDNMKSSSLRILYRYEVLLPTVKEDHRL